VKLIDTRIIVTAGLILSLLLQGCATGFPYKKHFTSNVKTISIDIATNKYFVSASRHELFSRFQRRLSYHGYYVYPYHLTEYFNNSQKTRLAADAILHISVMRKDGDLLKTRLERYKYSYQLVDAHDGTIYWEKKGEYYKNYDCKLQEISAGEGVGALIFYPVELFIYYPIRCSAVESTIKERLGKYNEIADFYYTKHENMLKQLLETLPEGPNPQ